LEEGYFLRSLQKNEHESHWCAGVKKPGRHNCDRVVARVAKGGGNEQVGGGEITTTSLFLTKFEEGIKYQASLAARKSDCCCTIAYGGAVRRARKFGDCSSYKLVNPVAAVTNVDGTASSRLTLASLGGWRVGEQIH
jgi:hypothetical protein